MTKLEQEYQMAYGGIPKDRESLQKYVREKYPPNSKRYEALKRHIYDIGWYRMQFGLELIPVPTPRPRLGTGNHFYVKGAAQNKQFMKEHIDRSIIYTKTIILIRGYVPTPSSMSNVEKNLAEEMLITPTNGADVDNIMKTYLDAIQGWLLVNDNIVAFSGLQKVWSVKPRLEIEIFYQDDFDCPYNARAMMSSKYYKRYLESGELVKYNTK